MVGIQLEFQIFDFVFEMVDDRIHPFDHGVGEFEQQVAAARGSMTECELIPDIGDSA